MSAPWTSSHPSRAGGWNDPPDLSAVSRATAGAAHTTQNADGSTTAVNPFRRQTSASKGTPVSSNNVAIFDPTKTPVAGSNPSSLYFQTANAAFNNATPSSSMNDSSPFNSAFLSPQTNAFNNHQATNFGSQQFLPPPPTMTSNPNTHSRKSSNPGSSFVSHSGDQYGAGGNAYFVGQNNGFHHSSSQPCFSVFNKSVANTISNSSDDTSSFSNVNVNESNPPKMEHVNGHYNSDQKSADSNVQASVDSNGNCLELLNDIVVSVRSRISSSDFEELWTRLHTFFIAWSHISPSIQSRSSELVRSLKRNDIEGARNCLYQLKSESNDDWIFGLDMLISFCQSSMLIRHSQMGQATLNGSQNSAPMFSLG